MTQAYIIKFLTEKNIIYKTIKESKQGRLHQGFFIDKNYYLKIYNDNKSYENAIQNSELGPAIIKSGIVEERSCILFKQIKGITVAELLCLLSEDEQKTVFIIITQLLKKIHQFGIKKEGKALIHGDYHIGNIIVSGNYLEIDNYHIIDRDMSHYGSFQGEYGVIIETIVAPVCMVGEELQEEFKDKNLLLWRDIINKTYPEFLHGNMAALKEEGIKRANKKFAYKNGSNERANDIGKAILTFLDSL